MINEKFVFILEDRGVLYINGSDVKSENGKSEKNSTIKAGINMNKKLINTIPSAGIFGSLYFKRFALTA